VNSIVDHGLKIDLHIHSCVSASKDGSKVKNNTLQNVPLLINKLNENGVNICAITDHDAFSLKMYNALKEAEEDDSSVQKVLPGVEFSVSFIDSEGKEQVVHVVAIFSDKDYQKISRVESILKSIRPNNNGAYTETSFLEVLREINLDTILIAHQKNSLGSKKPRKNDANTVGETKFLEFVASDYFEAFEFKNKRNEVLNKNYLLKKALDNRVRFVTGTDCHDWTKYPKEDSSDLETKFPYTFVKCLPTFKGLVMALTDQHRLKRVDSFFSVDKSTLDHIEIENNGKIERIPLSKGINVIIGDNSIGKSMLLHALCGFEKTGEAISRPLREGYKAYLKKKNLKIKRQLKSDCVFAFDMQGEVRRKFEENRLVASEFAKYFPPNVDTRPYRAIVDNEIDRLISHLERKFIIDSEIKKLNSFDIFIDTEDPVSLSFVGKLRNTKGSVFDIDSIISAIKQLQIDYALLAKQPLDPTDLAIIDRHSDTLRQMLTKYEGRKKQIEHENERIEIVARVIDEADRRHSKSISDRQKRSSGFLEKTASLKESLREIISKSENMKPYAPEIEKTIIEYNSNSVQDYNFVSRIKAQEISLQLFMQHVNSLFKSNKRVDLNTVTIDKLRDSLLKYDGSPVLQFFRDALRKSFEDDFLPKQTINLRQSEKTEELSAGLNAKIYFDLLSYEKNIDGVYIIDQPEDNVSQPSIKEHLLDCFKTMGENRQVIMVSHNPQFIVNLDVDNIIYLFCGDDGRLRFQSGALEYECDDYNVLQLVAENIDGGLDSIQKRWKRYEKNNRV